MTAYDLYRYFDVLVNHYMDSILIKEDPTEAERKNYETIRDWIPNAPNSFVKEILSSIKVPTGEKSE